MGSGIYIATSGATAQDTALDVVANNVSNASTTGYKAERVTFGSYLARSKSKDTTLAGVAMASTDKSQGAVQASQNPLDLAISGDGYFSVNTPQGVRYTRSGNFSLSDQNQLITQTGLAVRGVGGQPIVIPPESKSVSFDRDGNVYADQEKISQLELLQFEAQAMTRQGDNLFLANGPSTATGASVTSGAVESSNVNVVHEMVDMVRISRTYESLMRMIQGYKDIETAAARGLGRPR